MVGVRRVGWTLVAGVLIVTSCGGSSQRRNEDGDGDDPTAGAEGDDSGDDDSGDDARGGGSGTGGAAGTPSTGGTAGTAGTTSTGGTGGTGGRVNCERPLPDVAEIGCDYRAALGAPGVVGYCFKGGCHNATTRAGALDLTLDDHLAARLLDMPANHQLFCPGNVACDPAQATCATCSECPSGALLIDTSDPEASWILRTMDPFVPGTTTRTLSIECGDAMPTFNTTGTTSYTQAHKDCLRAFFLALAATPGDWPCVP